MIKRKVKLDNINSVKKFIEIVNKCDFNIDIVSHQRVIDAKSILGVLSLDLSDDLELRIYTDRCDRFLKELSIYAV